MNAGDQTVRIPESMRAVVLTAHGSMDKLVFHNDWPVPKPDNNEVLIKVTACGMNNTDVNTRSGWYSKAVSEATTEEAYDSVGSSDPCWLPLIRLRIFTLPNRLLSTNATPEILC